MIIKVLFSTIDKRYHLALVDDENNDLVIQDFGYLIPNKLDSQEDYEILDSKFNYN